MRVARHQNSKSLGTPALDSDQQQYAADATPMRSAATMRARRRSEVDRSAPPTDAAAAALELGNAPAAVFISRFLRPIARATGGIECRSRADRIRADGARDRARHREDARDRARRLRLRGLPSLPAR